MCRAVVQNCINWARYTFFSVKYRGWYPILRSYIDHIECSPINIRAISLLFISILPSTIFTPIQLLCMLSATFQYYPSPYSHQSIYSVCCQQHFNITLHHIHTNPATLCAVSNISILPFTIFTPIQLLCMLSATFQY
jgi:hypothetical protein